MEIKANSGQGKGKKKPRNAFDEYFIEVTQTVIVGKKHINEIKRVATGGTDLMMGGGYVIHCNESPETIKHLLSK